MQLRSCRVATTVALLLLTCVSAGAGDAPGPQLFATSDRCAACHNGLKAPDGTEISFSDDWSGSLMANAARDPYWQASVRRELLAHPMAAEAIEHECAACHMPMSRFEARAGGGHDGIFAHLAPAGVPTRSDQLALDGVSCSVCHQISAEGLGEESSFTAGFEVDRALPLGSRQAFGPYEIDEGRRTVMSSASLFSPVKATHIQGSELCASCHTLITHSLDEDGNVIGELPEQVPYLEWRHGAYADVMSCQDCHMPTVDEPTAIASVLGQPREQVSRHVFRGGNFLVPAMLDRERTALGVVASSAALARTSALTREHLGESAAGLSVDPPRVSGSRASFAVTIESFAGHKLPTAYPSRRAWLHVLLRDVEGATVFESGRLREDGSIQGNDNDQDAARYEPHHRTIVSAEQVQIYEPILGLPDGRVTTVLLSADRYLKDNRLLPAGFDKQTAEPRIAVRGAALDDEDFTEGGDRVEFQIEVDAARGPFSVEVELLYQPIGYRWAMNVATPASIEAERFVAAFEALERESTALLARAEAVGR